MPLGRVRPLGMHYLRSIRVFVVTLLVAWLAVLPVLSYGQSLPVTPNVWSYGGAGGSLATGSISSVGTAAGRQWAANAVAGGVNVIDTAVARVAANDVAMLATRVIPWSGVVSAAAAALPYVAAGTAIYLLFDAYRCYAVGGSPGVMSCDAGQAAVTQSLWCGQPSSWPGSHCAASVAAFADQWVAYLNSTAYSYQRFRVNHLTAAAVYVDVSNDSGVTYGTYTSVGLTQQQTTACPAYTDPFDPARSSPAGAPLGPDGKCRGGGYSNVSTSSEVANVTATAPAAQKSNAVAIAQQTAPVVDLAPYAQPVTLTGPAAVNGPATVTTTTPAGGTATTTTTTPTYNITYLNNTYTFTTTNTTTSPTGTTSTTAPATAQACGLPGAPECAVKVDETGTADAPQIDTSPVDQAVSQDTSKRESTMGAVQGPSFGFIGAPPIASCTPFVMPTMDLGKVHAQIPDLNPCAAMEEVRGVMSYIWAAAAVWLCFGFVRRAVES